MQIKTTLKYHRTTLRKAHAVESENKCWEGRKGYVKILIPCWLEYKLVQILWE